MQQQLSFIQLCGGIMVGVYSEQQGYLQASDMPVFQTTSLGVWTTASYVYSQLSNDITLQMWLIGSVLCDIIIAVCMIYYVGFAKFLPLVFGEQLTHILCFVVAAFEIWRRHQTNSNTIEENYPADDRNRVFDRYINYIPDVDLCGWLCSSKPSLGSRVLC